MNGCLLNSNLITTIGCYPGPKLEGLKAIDSIAAAMYYGKLHSLLKMLPIVHVCSLFCDTSVELVDFQMTRSSLDKMPETLPCEVLHPNSLPNANTKIWQER